jgi:hypothetical protein
VTDEQCARTQRAQFPGKTSLPKLVTGVFFTRHLRVAYFVTGAKRMAQSADQRAIFPISTGSASLDEQNLPLFHFGVRLAAIVCDFKGSNVKD